MKLVMLGGTYNPPHLGHLKIAEAVRLQFGYDKLILVPSYRPAHKNVSEDISFQQRLKMVELAVQNWEDVIVSPCEYERKGLSYSIDTIRYLKEKYSLDSNPGLIIGDDLVPGFSRWHKVDDLCLEADIIVCHRGRREDLDFPYPHRYFENPIFEASSTEIRNRIKTGGDVQNLLPEEVLNYIRQEGLYGA
jgi:nicotinate-nucleotide adenylyltransferase